MSSRLIISAGRDPQRYRVFNENGVEIDGIEHVRIEMNAAGESVRAYLTLIDFKVDIDTRRGEE